MVDRILTDWSCRWGETYVSEPRPPTGLLFIPRDMWAWKAMVMMMPAGENTDSYTRALWQFYQQRHLGASRWNARRSENFAYQYTRYANSTLAWRKILRYGASRFTSHPKEGVLRMFIALKIHRVSRFEPANLRSSGKHTNHYTTEATWSDVTCAATGQIPSVLCCNNHRAWNCSLWFLHSDFSHEASRIRR
jgi:hypothetical protein